MLKSKLHVHMMPLLFFGVTNMLLKVPHVEESKLPQHHLHFHLMTLFFLHSLLLITISNTTSYDQHNAVGYKEEANSELTFTPHRITSLQIISIVLLDKCSLLSFVYHHNLRRTEHANKNAALGSLRRTLLLLLCAKETSMTTKDRGTNVTLMDISTEVAPDMKERASVSAIGLSSSTERAAVDRFAGLLHHRVGFVSSLRRKHVELSKFVAVGVIISSTWVGQLSSCEDGA
jgi:hypothetical protein